MVAAHPHDGDLDVLFRLGGVADDGGLIDSACENEQDAFLSGDFQRSCDTFLHCKNHA